MDPWVGIPVLTSIFAGNNFLGGVDYHLTDNVTVLYKVMQAIWAGRGEGYSHSLVFDFSLTERLNYVLESDWVETDGWYDVADNFYAQERDDIGINQYLFYELNACWKLGGRFEWWKWTLPPPRRSHGGRQLAAAPELRAPARRFATTGDRPAANLDLPDRFVDLRHGCDLDVLTRIGHENRAGNRPPNDAACDVGVASGVLVPERSPTPSFPSSSSLPCHCAWRRAAICSKLPSRCLIWAEIVQRATAGTQKFVAQAVLKR